MNRKRTVGFVSITMMFILLSGCSTTNPSAMKVLPRDQDKYVDQGATVAKKETKQGVAILVKHDGVKDGQEVASALDSSLTSILSDFAFFTIIERSNLDSLLKEQQLESLSFDNLVEIDIPQADYLITAKINAAQVNSESRKSLINNTTKTYYTAKTSVDFRFYEKSTKRTIMTKNIECEAPDEFTSRNESVAQLSVAAQECAKKFAMEIGSRYAPPARVIETRGGGKVAKITMGANYGLAKGMRVQFFGYVDNSDIVEGDTRSVSPVGYGFVLESDLKFAWVEIVDHEDSIVKRGHYVKISSDQSKGLKTKMRDSFKIM